MFFLWRMLGFRKLLALFVLRRLWRLYQARKRSGAAAMPGASRRFPSTQAVSELWRSRRLGASRPAGPRV
jgi:hypothetical protein